MKLSTILGFSAWAGLGLFSLSAWAEPQATCESAKAKAQGLVYWHRHKVDECRKEGDQEVLKGVPIDGVSAQNSDMYYRSMKLEMLAHLDGVTVEDMDDATGKPKAAANQPAGFRAFLKKLDDDLDSRKSGFTPEQAKAAAAYKANLKNFELALNIIRPAGATNSVTLSNVDRRFNLLMRGCSVDTMDDTCSGERSAGGINQLENVFPDFHADVKRIDANEDLEGDLKEGMGSLSLMKKIQACRDANNYANYNAAIAAKSCPKVDDAGTDKKLSGLPEAPVSPPITVAAQPTIKPGQFPSLFEYGPCTNDNPSGRKPKKPYDGPTIGPLPPGNDSAGNADGF